MMFSTNPLLIGVKIKAIKKHKHMPQKPSIEKDMVMRYMLFEITKLLIIECNIKTKQGTFTIPFTQYAQHIKGVVKVPFSRFNCNSIIYP